MMFTGRVDALLQLQMKTVDTICDTHGHSGHFSWRRCSGNCMDEAHAIAAGEQSVFHLREVALKQVLSRPLEGQFGRLHEYNVDLRRKTSSIHTDFGRNRQVDDHQSHH